MSSSIKISPANVEICILNDAKASQWAVFRGSCAISEPTFYCSEKKSASVEPDQVLIYLGCNQIRKIICQKLSLLSPFFWPLAYQLVGMVRLLLWHQSQYRHQSLQVNTNTLSQEPYGVLGRPRIGAIGGVQC